MGYETLLKAATAVRDNAYAPYSHFKVGAAVLAEDGHTYVGCNVENSSFGATVCAERSAVSAMVAAGARRILAVAVYTPAATPTYPCGICRQVLAEFGPDAVVLAAVPGQRVQVTLSELLPHAFVFRP